MDRVTDLLADPGILLAALFSVPLFNLAVAALIVGIGLALRRSRAPRAVASDRFDELTAARYRPEGRVLAIGAVVVLVAYATENIVRGYVLHLADIVEWWQYATAVFAVLIVVIALLVTIVARRSAVEAPVRSATRRTWASFGSRAPLLGTGGAALLLIATTAGAGLASSADDRGRFIYLALPVTNTDVSSLHLWFYGWSFGVPVLVCTGSLLLSLWAALQFNAVRPFIRPETVAAESTARRSIADGAALIAAAGMLLALGGAWRFIARTGTISTLEVGDDPTVYDVTWRFAEIATLVGWLAPVAEIIGFALLLLVASRPIGSSRRRAAAPSPDSVDELLEGARR